MDRHFTLAGSLAPMLKQGWYWGNDGKMHRMPSQPLLETPWIYFNMGFQCVMWNEMFFRLVSKESMIHSHCQECYKVVIAPRTVEELIALENWMKTLTVQCKCGIELRDYVNRKRIYGGYFYNRGVEEGRERFAQVKAWAQFIHDKDKYENIFEKKHDTPIPVILKNGCTEFERALGSSLKWEVTEEQKKIEEKFHEIIDFDPFDVPKEIGHFPQPEPMRQYVRMMWLKWAHANGDMTYVKFAPGQRQFEEAMDYFTFPPATYHDEPSFETTIKVSQKEKDDVD